MSNEKTKKKKPRYVTPVGTVRYPYLNTPRDRIGDRIISPPKYTCELVIDPNDPKAVTLIEAINALVEETYNDAVNRQTAKERKQKPLVHHYPYIEELDDDGNETGKLILKAANPSRITKADGTEVDFKVILVDKFGKEYAEGSAPIIHHGSKVRLNVSMAAFASPGIGRAGVNLYLNAVQVVELAERANTLFDPIEGASTDDDDDDDDAPFNTGDDAEAF